MAAATAVQHVLDRRVDGWTIKHPLACRPQLFDCPVNVAAERQLLPPTFDEVGRFVIDVTDVGALIIGIRVDGADPVPPDPDHVSVLGGVECARWGQAPAVPPGEPVDPLPTIYSSADGVEIEDTFILDLAAAEAFAERLLAAIAYERRRTAAACSSTPGEVDA